MNLSDDEVKDNNLINSITVNNFKKVTHLY